MVKQHLKRIASPRTWPIERKNLVFVARPNPGPHSLEYQIPISVFLKEMVHVVKTTKEVKHILHNKGCFIDGKNVYDDKRPVGLLDVVTLPIAGLQFRVSINEKQKLVALPITAKESTVKVCKITSKVSLKQGIIQLGTLDGRSFRVKDVKEHAVGDSLVISLPDQKIVDHLPLQKGALIFLEAGRHTGIMGQVESIDKDIVALKVGDHMYKTKKQFAVVVGKKDIPLITVQKKEQA